MNLTPANIFALINEGIQVEQLVQGLIEKFIALKKSSGVSDEQILEEAAQAGITEHARVKAWLAKLAADEAASAPPAIAPTEG